MTLTGSAQHRTSPTTRRLARLRNRTAFGSQTYFIRVSSAGVVSATIDGVRIAVGDNPTATATSTLLPVQWVEYIKCSPGQKIAVLGNNTGTGSVNVTELTD
jgi:hypothetical protein